MIRIVSIVVLLYFIVSTICMLVVLKDEPEEVETSLIIFGLLVFPIALVKVSIIDNLRRRDK